MIIQVNKEELLEKFRKKYIVDRWVNEFVEIDERYKSDKGVIQKNLISKFDLVCKEAISFQEKELKGDIKYIYLSLLRTSFLENKGECRIDLYDENWFLDKAECSINIELEFIYDSLFKRMEELKEKKKEYGRNIRDVDIENMMLVESNKYHFFAMEFLKSIIEEFIEAPSYKQMKKNEDISIMAGEYMDATEIIYPKLKDN